MSVCETHRQDTSAISVHAKTKIPLFMLAMGTILGNYAVLIGESVLCLMK